MKKLGLLLLIITAGAAMLLTGCGQSAKAEVAPSASPAAENQPVEAFGKIKAVDTQNVVLDFPAALLELHVSSGQKVQQGDALIKVDISDFQKQIKTKEQELAIAQLELEKTQKEKTNAMYTWSQKNLSIKIKKEQIALLEQDVKSLKSKLEKSGIKKGILSMKKESGVIDEVNCTVGDVLQPGTPLFRILNVEKLYVQADVPEEFIKDVQIGSSVKIIPTFDRSKTYTGSVSAVSHTAILQNGETIIPIDITLDEPVEALKYNYNVEVYIDKKS